MLTAYKLGDIHRTIAATEPKNRAIAKARAICQCTQPEKVTTRKNAVEIVSIKEIEGGVEVLARAWKNGKRVGFGADGSVEIERFRVFNPPVLVDDPNGDIVRENEIKLPDGTTVRSVRKLREDPKAAIMEVIAHNVKVVGKSGTNIIIGKIGNTTSTFYPDAHTESTSVDGYVKIWASQGGGYATLHDAANGTTVQDSSTVIYMMNDASGGDYNIIRTITLFDTSAIPDGDTISAATYSLRGDAVVDTLAGSNEVRMVTSNPTSNTALAVGDYNKTKFSTASQATADIGFSSWNTSGYNDFTLNATGILNISKTGITKFGARVADDCDNVTPGVTAATNYARALSADAAGTTSDPKLVVVHAASAPGLVRIERTMMRGEMRGAMRP